MIIISSRAFESLTNDFSANKKNHRQANPTQTPNYPTVIILGIPDNAGYIDTTTRSSYYID